MTIPETTIGLQRLEKATRWLYWSGTSLMVERKSSHWPTLRFALTSLLGLLLIRHLGIPFLMYLGDAEESAIDQINTITSFYLSVTGIGIALIQTEKRRQRHSKSFRRINSELAQLLGYAKPEHLDILCRIWRNLEGLLWDSVKEQLENTLANFLFAMGAEEISLSGSSVKWLKYQAKCGKNPRLRVAALITIKDRNLNGLEELALSASRSNNDRVRAAARDILTTMRGTR